MPPQLSFHPPLLNSASPWATTAADLRTLLLCPSTGAVTTRTSLLDGFHHRPEQHQYVFFNVGAGPSPSSRVEELPSHSVPGSKSDAVATASLNSLGYSPLTLDDYLFILADLSRELPHLHKTILVSVTGTPDDILACYNAVSAAPTTHAIHFPLALEINLSCPNIPSASPPAYSASSLSQYLDVLPTDPVIPVGIKTPPYTYHEQFTSLAFALLTPPRTGDSTPNAAKISFLTSTNTLGSCLLLDDVLSPVLPGSGAGGMAGTPLHPLALGNVGTLRQLFDKTPDLQHIQIIGVGGVGDGAAYKRMRAVGAFAVGLATELGRRGVAVFADIERDVGGW